MNPGRRERIVLGHSVDSMQCVCTRAATSVPLSCLNAVIGFIVHDIASLSLTVGPDDD
jgi:hypothetical protein